MSIQKEPGGRSIGPIFISHATVDKDDVIALCDALRDSFHGEIRTFNTSAAAIAPGQPWRERILSAIRGSSLVVLWATSQALESREVAFEVGAALASDKQLIPCCVHVAPSKLPWSLSETQALTQLDKEEGWIRLADTVGNIINYSGTIDSEPLRRLSESFRATNDAVQVIAVGRIGTG